MKKIFIINDHHTAMGGADRIALELCEELTKENYDVRLFTYNNVSTDYYKVSWRNVLKNFFNFKVYFQLRSELRAYCPDVIIIHSWTKKLSSSCFLGCRGYDTRIVAHDYFLMCPNGGQYNYVNKKKCEYAGGSFSCLTTNCDKNSYSQKLYRFLRFWVQTLTIKLLRPKIICLNQIQMQMLPKGRNKSVCVPNNVSYMNDGFNDDIGDNIVFIGRPDPEKGLDRVLSIADRHCYPIDLIGVNADDIGETVKRDVSYYGWIDAKAVALRLSVARLLIFPSRWLEVDPLVPLEACSRGVPVFCSRDNVFADTLKWYGLTDYIFYDSDDLLLRLEKIYVDAGRMSTKEKFYDLFITERLNREKFGFQEHLN